MNRREFIFAAALLGSAFAHAGGSPLADMRAGDVLFRLGADDIYTRIIATYSPLPASARRFTHVAVALSEKLIIHALPPAVVLDSRDRFFSASECRVWAILRHHDSVRARALALAAAAMQGRQFDWSMRASESDKLYCTELVWLACRKAGIDISATRVKVPTYSEPVIHPDTFYDDLRTSGFAPI